MASEVYTVSQALDKAMKYCAYQERCQQEVRQKLQSFQLTSDQREEVIYELIQQSFLNEERFSESFARGKFRMKKWGKKKIILSLRQKEISDYCIKKGLLQIEENEYIVVLNQVLEKIYSKYTGIQDYQRMAKTAQYAIGRGFESQLVWEQLKNITND
jgi:regulatory protein